MTFYVFFELLQTFSRTLQRFVVRSSYNLFLQSCSSWQDFDWRSASLGPSAVAEILVTLRGFYVARDLRYDTRCNFNVRSKADMSQLNLQHGTDN